MCRAYPGTRIRNYREKSECELEVIEYVIFREAWIELRYVKAPRFSTSNLTWLADSSLRSCGEDGSGKANLLRFAKFRYGKLLGI